jgi:hypothetical protein
LWQLISSALTVNTWRKHSSGWNAFKDFENYCDSKFVWPLKIKTFRSFVIYCLTCRKISVATTKSYLASIKLAHELQNFSCVNFSKDRIINLLYAGSETLIVKNTSYSEHRRAMNLATLLLIGHRVAQSDWKIFSKQIVWTACTLAFFYFCKNGRNFS